MFIWPSMAWPGQPQRHQKKSVALPAHSNRLQDYMSYVMFIFRIYILDGNVRMMFTITMYCTQFTDQIGSIKTFLISHRGLLSSVANCNRRATTIQTHTQKHTQYTHMKELVRLLSHKVKLQKTRGNTTTNK